MHARRFLQDARCANSLSTQQFVGFATGTTYTYDQAGNRLTTGGSWARTLLPDAVTTATYDAANRQLTFGSKTMTFDNNGNLATVTEGGQTTTYTWNTRDQLTSLSGPAVTASFAYNALNRRSQKTIGGTTTTFQYDAADIVREVVGGTGVNYLRGLAIDETLARIESTNTAQYLADALGGTVALTDGIGSVATSYTYGPFGQSTTTGSPSPNAFQYTGRENDGIGLYHYRARQYSAVLQRFISEDPIGLAGDDTNLYAYVWNRPVNFSDPLGLWGWLVGVGGSAEAGFVSFGAGGTGSVVGGLFGGGPRGVNLGGVASAGATAGNPAYGKGYPRKGNAIAGAYIGGGVQLGYTNARCAPQLEGEFMTASFNFGLGSLKFNVQYSWSGDIRVVSVGPPVPFLGGGVGIIASGYPTNSWTTR